MRNTIFILILSIAFCSCSSSLIKRTDQEQIFLKYIESEAVTIGFENEKSIIRFEKADLVNLFKKENSDFSTQVRKERIERLEDIKADTIIPISRSSTESWELEIKFNELLTQGKAEVFNKRTGELVERIGYLKSVDKLGGVEVKYSFIDGTVFYNTVLKLGE